MMIMFKFLPVVMPLMGLGVLPFLVHCQLFGGHGLPPNYPPGALTGLFGILGFGGYPHLPGPPFPGLPSYRNDMYSYGPPPPPPPPPPMPMDYGRPSPNMNMYPPPMPYSSPNTIVLPKLPVKYDSGIYKSSPNYYEKSSYPPYKIDRPYPPYKNDRYYGLEPPAYPTKPLYEKSGSQYKSVYPKSNINGQPYGSYRDFLKTILSGQSASYVPSYSHNMPSVKSVLGNDYSSLTGKSPSIIFEKPEPVYPPMIPQEEQKVILPAMYSDKQQSHPDMKENYPKPYPDMGAYAKPSYQIYSADQKTGFVQPAPYPPSGLYDQKILYQPELPSIYQEKSLGYPDFKMPYPLPPMYGDRKPTFGYPMTYEIPSLPMNYQYQPERRQQIGSAYDTLQVYNNIGLKPSSSYPVSVSPPPPPPPPPGYDLTYDTDGNGYVQSKSHNQPTYSSAEKPTDYKRDQQIMADRKAAPPTDENYTPAKYPTLGYEVDRDQRKPVPAIIAALFGGGKYGKTTDYAQTGDQYGRAQQKTSQESQPANKQGYYGAAGTNYESSFSKDTKDTANANAKYAAQSGQNSPVDIFIPIGRSSKYSESSAKSSVH